jgi:glycosyltransferase involved in cell wall biosynthesis
VVAGNLAAALDALINGGSGLPVDRTDHAAVAKAITRLLFDHDFAQRLRAARAERAPRFASPVIRERLRTVRERQLDACCRFGRRAPEVSAEVGA